jgi:hypothetical protein
MADRRIRPSWRFLVMGILILVSMLDMTCKKRNQPPGAPSIPSGPVSGRKSDSLRFSTMAEDPDGDSVSVRFDWGDSTMSNWSALVPSRDSVVMTHAWQRLGTYSIRAQAKDAKETASAWSGEHQIIVASFSAVFGGAGDEWGWFVQQTSDGGYIVTGSTSSFGAGGIDIWLVKTDGSGNRIWDKTYGGAGDDYGSSVQQTSDGGYIIVGGTTSYGAGGHDVWLVRTDADGNEVWDKTFGGAGYDYGTSVEQTSDGGYVVAGSAGSSGAGGFDVWLIKTDASGNETWDKTFGGPDRDEGFSVQQTSDDGYIIAGWTTTDRPGYEHLWLIRTDLSGNKVWDKVFGVSGIERGNSVRQTYDGGYVVAGWTTSYGAGSSDVWLVKTDSSGNQDWNRTFGGPGSDGGNSVQQTSDGGYIVAGWTDSSGAGGGHTWLLKTTASGNRRWDRTFEGISGSGGYSARQTSDGGYIVAGSTGYHGTGNSDVWLIKTDADGN